MNEQEASMDKLKRVSHEELEMLTIQRNKLIKEATEKISHERQKLQILESKYQGYVTDPPFLCNRYAVLRIMVQEATRDCSNELYGQDG